LILDDLLKPPNAMTRGEVHHIAKLEGFNSWAITTELQRLIADERVFIHEVPGLGGGAQRPTHLYYTQTTRAILVESTETVNKRLATIVTRPMLKKACEQYTRALIRNARDAGQPFGHIVSKGKLGQRQIVPYLKLSEKADLVVPYAMQYDTLDLLTESKNEHEYIAMTSKHLRKLLGQALLNNMHPVLVAANMTTRAKRLCEALGISYLELRRQILPATVRAQVKLLYPKVWRTRFSIVNLDDHFLSRPRVHPDKRIERDLRIVSDPRWIEEPRAKWLAMRESLPVILRALEEKDWFTLNTLIA
jgi:hypothetical protein